MAFPALRLIAPIELADFSRAPSKIPVAPESAYPRLVRPRDNDITRDPVLAVANDHRLILVLALDRGHRAFDELVDAEHPRVSVDIVGDARLAHAEKVADQ